MTRERAITLIKSRCPQNPRKPWGVEYKNACEMAIKALEQEPCDDAISRQAAISVIYDRKSDFKNDFTQGFFADKIRELPPVAPQSKIGRWINDSCSICNYGVQPWNNTPYCPNCGSYNGGTEKCQ